MKVIQKIKEWLKAKSNPGRTIANVINDIETTMFYTNCANPLNELQILITEADGILLMEGGINFSDKEFGMIIVIGYPKEDYPEICCRPFF